jgi:hypothetical protein
MLVTLSRGDLVNTRGASKSGTNLELGELGRRQRPEATAHLDTCGGGGTMADGEVRDHARLKARTERARTGVGPRAEGLGTRDGGGSARVPAAARVPQRELLEWRPVAPRWMVRSGNA